MVTFFGTSPRSAKFLEQAIQNGLLVNLVVSAPPKSTGKKRVLTENPTAAFAKEKGIPSILNLSDLSDLSDLRLGLILDFNKIIPQEIINLFPRGIINIHFSKLPQYRGPAPVQYTILNGDKEAWITYYFINENLDEGQILTQTSLALDLTEDTEILYQKLITKASREIPAVIGNYLSGKIQPRQQEGISSPTKKLTTENSKIDWTKSPFKIEHLIRAAYPEPTAWTSVEIPANSAGRRSKSVGIQKLLRLKVLSAHLEQGKLIIDRVQLEGKNPVTWKQFQEGHPSFSLS